MTSAPRYLEGEALSAAIEWLNAHNLRPGTETTTSRMINAHYPGGLHFFIAEHLVSPPELPSRGEVPQKPQLALF